MNLQRKHFAKHTRHSKKPQHRSKIILLAVALLVIVALLITATRYFKGEPSLVTVNGESISATNVDSEIARLKKATPELFTKEYGDKSSSQVKQGILDSLINEKLLAQEAYRRGLRVNSIALTQTKSAIRSKFATEEQYQQFLSKSGITADQLSEALTNNLLVRKGQRALKRPEDR